ncbi:hypothetical protein [Gloeobacter morelensis]|uniref:Uncharacterized protein n=1 Tax=Gloeobacter morelensis MG652769 TaxID=2781736 RepID=A0ABY3PGI0_9CYAN|nr:hypothetical protein [Gloeobacter morelensis]UFP92767.1 hypothetical protein ISF26_13105 [Gloeobacter morelensis MG652769]
MPTKDRRIDATRQQAQFVEFQQFSLHKTSLLQLILINPVNTEIYCKFHFFSALKHTFQRNGETGMIAPLVGLDKAGIHNQSVFKNLQDPMKV